MIRSILSRPLREIARAYGGEPAIFPSELPSIQALDQLRKLISWSSAPYMLGSIREDRVKLRTTSTKNLVNPTVFYGRVQAHGDGSELVGVFKSSGFRRCSGGMFLLVIGLMFLCGAIETPFYIVYHAPNLLSGLELAAFSVLWLSLVALFAWFVAWNISPVPRDIQTISAEIRQGLKSPKSDS